MNSRCMALVVLAIATAASPAIAQGPVGTAFTYQGSLNDGGAPADGDYDFQFRLFSAPAAGIQIGGDVAINAWPISGGLFTVQLDFGPSVFRGSARWLEISVRQTGFNRFVTLSPRQELTPTPYSIFSSSADALVMPFEASVDHNGCVFSITNTSNLGFSSAICGISEADFGRGVTGQATGISGTNWGGWFQTNSTEGRGVIGFATTGNGTNYGVWGESASADGTGVFGRATSPEGSGIGGHFFSDGATGRGVVATATADSGEVNYGLFARSDSRLGTGVYGQADRRGVHGRSSAGTGVLGETTSGGDDAGVFGHATATQSSAKGVLGISEGVLGTGVRGEGTVGVVGRGLAANGYGGWFMNSATGGMALRVDGDAAIHGTATVDVLEITGGADLAERFEVSEPARPGLVLAIDPLHPGKFRISRGAYNRRVAGVVSGANTLSAGVVLGTAPASPTNLPVALSGRVWVYCDASAKAVQLGDFLTTAAKPGYAMPVIDRAKAEGAVIGKAMTALPQGEQGMVLVLVNLQ